METWELDREEYRFRLIEKMLSVESNQTDRTQSSFTIRAETEPAINRSATQIFNHVTTIVPTNLRLHIHTIINSSVEKDEPVWRSFTEREEKGTLC